MNTYSDVCLPRRTAVYEYDGPRALSAHIGQERIRHIQRTEEVQVKLSLESLGSIERRQGGSTYLVVYFLLQSHRVHAPDFFHKPRHPCTSIVNYNIYSSPLVICFRCGLLELLNRLCDIELE